MRRDPVRVFTTIQCAVYARSAPTGNPDVPPGPDFDFLPFVLDFRSLLPHALTPEPESKGISCPLQHQSLWHQRTRVSKFWGSVDKSSGQKGHSKHRAWGMVDISAHGRERKGRSEGWREREVGGERAREPSKPQAQLCGQAAHRQMGEIAQRFIMTP